MSGTDKELISLYKTSGTGTGSGLQIGTGDGSSVPADETEVVESGQALKNLGWAAVFTLLAGTGQFIQAVAPTLTQLALSHLPNIPMVSAQLVSAVILGFAAYLQKKAAAKHKVAVVKALVTDPSTDMKEAYVEEKGK